MSHPRHWWYTDIKRAIMRSPSFRFRTEPEYQRYTEAIDKALADVKTMNNANERLYAINEVLIKKTLTIDGVALRTNYSWRVVQKWINDFVNSVGKYKGFESD